MVSDKEALDQVHLIIHSIRLLTGYKSSEAEKKIGRVIREYYQGTCQECKEINEKVKNQPEKKDGLMSRIKSAMGEE